MSGIISYYARKFAFSFIFGVTVNILIWVGYTTIQIVFHLCTCDKGIYFFHPLPKKMWIFSLYRGTCDLIIFLTRSSYPYSARYPRKSANKIITCIETQWRVLYDIVNMTNIVNISLCPLDPWGFNGYSYKIKEYSVFYDLSNYVVNFFTLVFFYFGSFL